MIIARRLAIAALAAIVLFGLFAPVIAPYPYDRQFRDRPDAGPSHAFPMGTDEIGRDRFSRLAWATRISVLLAPAAAFASIALALAISAFSGFRSRLMRRLVESLTTVCLSLPWIFLFIVLRAELPLNTGPAASVALTFGLMGVAGWAWPGRVFTAAIGEMVHSDWMMQARAAGISDLRIAAAHAWPHLKSLAAAQFRVLIPAYILSEASLGLLGLGVPDPLPSWGNLLRDLQQPDVVKANPWALAPLAILMIAMISLELLQSRPEPAI
ncbi:MAG TPA: ABC transporter permease [Bryobacteraceae bacterium]|nr:ABC transporter permease [Bryobacteraceae bacterium]